MRVLNRKNATFLILLSCLTYSTAYVGRLCYGANLISIRGDFGIDQAIAGTVSSFYFFSYAAGQLINNAARASSRKQTVDEKFMETQFDSVTTLYGLDKLNTLLGTTDFGPLPVTAVVLLVSLAVAWGLILVYVIFQKVKQKGKH